MFIELHSTFLRHRKIARLAAKLGLGRRDARAILTSLWLTVLENDPDGGTLRDWTDREIAEACEWDPDLDGPRIPEDTLRDIVSATAMHTSVSADCPRTVRGRGADSPSRVSDASVFVAVLCCPEIRALVRRDGEYCVKNWTDYTVFLRRRLRESQRKRLKRQQDRETEKQTAKSVRGQSADRPRTRRGRVQKRPPEPEPQPEPQPDLSLRANGGRDCESSDSREEREDCLPDGGLDLAGLERAGFERFGALRPIDAGALHRYVPIASHEWARILKTQAKSWAYVVKCLADYRSQIAEPKAPPAGAAPRDMDAIWAEVQRIASGSQRTPHSDPIAQAVIGALGGQRTLGAMTDYAFRQARAVFIDAYEARARST